MQRAAAISIPLGPIEAANDTLVDARPEQFQFHLVRLKLAVAMAEAPSFSQFQFHLVRLKLPYGASASWLLKSFQFHLVRLKR